MAASALPFSKTRRAGGLLHLAGQIGNGPDGALPAGIEAQTKNALENLAALLKTEGLTMADVVSCTCYLTDVSDFAAFNAVYAGYFTDPRPVRTTVQSGLMLEGAIVEITAIAELK